MIIESNDSSQDRTPKERQVKLRWNRNRLFDKLVTVTLFSLIASEKTATVNKWEVNMRYKRQIK